MGAANCSIGLGATDCTEELREPEGSYQPELSVQCCRLPLRSNNQSDGWPASVHTVNLVQTCQKEVDGSHFDIYKICFPCHYKFTA
jgi:hypothetical protein